MQRELGFDFHCPQLLFEALTHPSYVNERPGEIAADNERLEFLGDAVLGLLVAEDLFLRYPIAREGELTAMRAALVRKDTLARVSRRLHLGEHLFLGLGEENSGGRERIANLCAALEAVIGATFLDRGLEDTRRLVRSLLGEGSQAPGAGPEVRDAKSALQERVQGALHCTPYYRTVSETGPDHAKVFIVEAVVGDRVVGTGRGANKQAAEQSAARAALQNPELESTASTPL